MHTLHIGKVNGHIIGRVLKEAVRRATVIIRNERSHFVATTKMSYSGVMDDVFTSADRKAQDVYLRTFRECFPLLGVVAEEDELATPATAPCTAYFTVDPLDGTKAYIRRQSHGISTMVSLVDTGSVIAAYIGDINADEVFGYRPGSDAVYRITALDTFERLERTESLPLVQSFGLLRDPAHEYSAFTQTFIERGLKSYEIMGSSIGTWYARLWKNEVAALLIPPGWETPWDSSPIIGISQKLGYVFLRPCAKGTDGYWEVYEPLISPTKYERRHDTLVVHRSNLTEVLAF